MQDSPPDIAHYGTCSDLWILGYIYQLFKSWTRWTGCSRGLAWSWFQILTLRLEAATSQAPSCVFDSCISMRGCTWPSKSVGVSHQVFSSSTLRLEDIISQPHPHHLVDCISMQGCAIDTLLSNCSKPITEKQAEVTPRIQHHEIKPVDNMKIYRERLAEKY